MKREQSIWLSKLVLAMTCAGAYIAMLAVTGPVFAGLGEVPRFCRGFIGTYLVANLDDDRSIDSLSLLVFSADGTFGFIDSNQGGVPGEFNPFTDAAGEWSCGSDGGRQVARAIALDFTLPGSLGREQAIARLDFFDVTLDSGRIRGAATLRFFSFNEDPLNPTQNRVEPFFFDGRRVTLDPS